jgi:hypothetical protein
MKDLFKDYVENVLLPVFGKKPEQKPGPISIEDAHREVTTYSDGRCRHQWIGIDHMMWECALCSKVRTHD